MSKEYSVAIDGKHVGTIMDRSSGYAARSTMLIKELGTAETIEVTRTSDNVTFIYYNCFLDDTDVLVYDYEHIREQKKA